MKFIGEIFVLPGLGYNAAHPTVQKELSGLVGVYQDTSSIAENQSLIRTSESILMNQKYRTDNINEKITYKYKENKHDLYVIDTYQNGMNSIKALKISQLLNSGNLSAEHRALLEEALLFDIITEEHYVAHPTGSGFIKGFYSTVPLISHYEIIRDSKKRILSINDFTRLKAMIENGSKQDVEMAEKILESCNYIESYVYCVLLWNLLRCKRKIKTKNPLFITSNRLDEIHKRATDFQKQPLSMHQLEFIADNYLTVNNHEYSEHFEFKIKPKKK